MPRLLTAVAIVVFAASFAAAGDPVRGSINAAYRYDRRAVDNDFDRHEDAVRDTYRAIRDHEEADWKFTRKQVSPHERRVIDQQYHYRRKTLNRQMAAELNALARAENQARGAMKDDYRRSLRGYNDQPQYEVRAPRYEVPAPRYVPYEDFENNYRGPVYDDRSVVPPQPQSQPQDFEPLPAPAPTTSTVRPRAIAVGILNEVLR